MCRKRVGAASINGLARGDLGHFAMGVLTSVPTHASEAVQTHGLSVEKSSNREVSETEQKATLFRGPVARNGNALQRTKPLKGDAVPERVKKGGSQPNDCRPPVILR